MDIDKYLEFEFDYSRINPEEFEWMGGVTFYEIEEIFKNERTVFYDRSSPPFKLDRWECIGFGGRSRCLELLFEFNEDDKISFIVINLSTEHGIEQYWCRRGFETRT